MKDVAKLIPVKKPVVDIDKGLIVRTYYYRPSTLLEQLEKLKAEPNVNYFTTTPLVTEYSTFLKTGDISSYSNIFKPEDWNVISKLSVSDIHTNTNVNENKVLYQLTSSILSGDKLFLKKFKTSLKETAKEQDIMFYTVKTKKKLDDIFQRKPNKFKEIKKYNIVRISSIVSNTVNFYNPRKPKLDIFIKSLIGTDFVDESMVAHHLVMSERLLNKIPDTFVNLTKSTIKIYTNSLFPSRVDRSFIKKYLPYNIYKVLKIDVKQFKEIANTYSYDDYIVKIVDSLDSRTLSSDAAIMYGQLVLLPKKLFVESLNNTIFSDEKNFPLDYMLLTVSSQRDDLSVVEFDNIMFRFLLKYYDDIIGKDALLVSFISGCFNNTPNMVFTLFQYILSRLRNRLYLPLSKDFRLLDPEIGSMLFMLSNPNNTTTVVNTAIDNELEKVNENSITIHIPIIKKFDFENIEGVDVIPYRLMNIQLAVTNPDIISEYKYVSINIKNDGNLMRFKSNNDYILWFI